MLKEKIKKDPYMATIYFIFIAMFVIGFLLYARHLWRIHPHINPAPRRFLTVSGQVDSGIVPKFYVTYRTTNPKCLETVDWLEGVDMDRYYSQTVPVEVHNGRYKTRLVLDYYRPDYCRWSLDGINYEADYHNLSTGGGLFWFSKKNQSMFLKGNFSVDCSVQQFEHQIYLDCWPDTGGISGNTKSVGLNFHLTKRDK